MLAALLELTPHAKARFAFDDVRQAVLLPRDGAGLAVIDRETHATRDVHTNGVGNHAVISRQHTTNRQAETLMRIRHERPCYGDGQSAGVCQLLHRTRIESDSPLMPGRGSTKRAWRDEVLSLHNEIE